MIDTEGLHHWQHLDRSKHSSHNQSQVSPDQEHPLHDRLVISVLGNESLGNEVPL